MIIIHFNFYAQITFRDEYILPSGSDRQGNHLPSILPRTKDRPKILAQINHLKRLDKGPILRRWHGLWNWEIRQSSYSEPICRQQRWCFFRRWCWIRVKINQITNLYFVNSGKASRSYNLTLAIKLQRRILIDHLAMT